MELTTLWKIVLRRWWIIALPALVALVYAGYGYLKAPQAGGFSTQVRFTAAQSPERCRSGYEDCRYYPWLTSEYIVGALSDWIKTSSFAGAVSDELARQGETIPAGALQGAIHAQYEHSIISLSISWPDGAQLEDIAQAATTVLQERSDEFFPQLGQQGLVVIPLDAPAIAPVPPPLSNRLDPLIRFGLGLAAGIALAFLVEYLDPALHDRAELEALGLKVLAEVPSHRRGLAKTNRQSPITKN
jgi:capsular polysaccharide biosynthesis protein